MTKKSRAVAKHELPTAKNRIKNLPKSPPPPPSKKLRKTSKHHILCGPKSNHPGNRRFRKTARAYQAQYRASKRCDKKIVGAKVLEVVRESGGRFL